MYIIVHMQLFVMNFCADYTNGTFYLWYYSSVNSTNQSTVHLHCFQPPTRFHSTHSCHSSISLALSFLKEFVTFNASFIYPTVNFISRAQWVGMRPSSFERGVFQILNKQITLRIGMTWLFSPALPQLSGRLWKKRQSLILKRWPTVCLFDQISEQMCADESSFEPEARVRPWRKWDAFWSWKRGLVCFRCNIAL